MARLSPEELATRRNGLGSSDVVEALGLAPWEGAGPMRLFLEKTEGAMMRQDETGALDWGHLQEPVILKWYEDTTGRRCLPGGQVPHRDYPWLWATLDAKADDRIVEIKHVSSHMAWHWNESQEDGVPHYVRVQCIVGQACLGTTLTDVTASIGGRPPHVWTVAWDGELWAQIERMAKAFWAMVVAKKAPKLDATPATKEYLRRRYPSNEDRVIVQAPPELEEIAQARIEAAIAERQAAEHKASYDVELLEAIGSHDGIKGDGWKLTWRLDKNGVRRQRFTAEVLREST